MHHQIYASSLGSSTTPEVHGFTTAWEEANENTILRLGSIDDYFVRPLSLPAGSLARMAPPSPYPSRNLSKRPKDEMAGSQDEGLSSHCVPRRFRKDTLPWGRSIRYRMRVRGLFGKGSRSPTLVPRSGRHSFQARQGRFSEDRPVHHSSEVDMISE